MKACSVVIKMPIVISLIVSVGVIALLAGCSSSSENSKSGSSGEIVTSLYPIEFIVSKIIKDDFEVVNLTPIGVEPHDFELNVNSTERLLSAPLAIVLGGGFQPVIEKTAKNRSGQTLSIFETFSQGNGNFEDMHFWLDPIKMQSVVKSITSALIKLNKSQAAQYEVRSKELQTELADLDDLYKTSLTNCEIRTFITSHNAFSRLAERYDLEQEPIAGISPDTEPSAKRIEELKSLVKNKKIEVIFTEELVSPKVVKILGKEAKVRTSVLSPLEGLTKEQESKGEDYFSIMESNLQKLVEALRCEIQI